MWIFVNLTPKNKERSSTFFHEVLFPFFCRGLCVGCLHPGEHTPAREHDEERPIPQCNRTEQGCGSTSTEMCWRKGKTLHREWGTQCDKALWAPREDGEGWSPRHSSMDYPTAHEGHAVEQVFICSPGHTSMIHELFHLNLSPCCWGKEVTVVGIWVSGSQPRSTDHSL